MKQIFALKLCAVFALFALWSPVAWTHAHPFHTTSAEMELNPKTGRYEVSLRVLASDLESALTRHSASVAARDAQIAHHAEGDAAPFEHKSVHQGTAIGRIDLEHTPEVDRKIVSYLRQNIFLSAVDAQATGEPVEKRTEENLVWVGKELERSWAWLYFELQPPEGAKELKLTNKIFMEMNSGQINIMTLRRADSRLSLRTEAKRPTANLPPNSPSR